MGITGTLRSAKHKIERLRYRDGTYLPSREHWIRQVMDRHLDEVLDRLDPPTLDAVEVSGESHSFRPWKSYTVLRWPDFDLCADDQPVDRQYDVVLCEQVLEHVPDPWAAARTLRRLAKSGGTVVVTTPFLIRIHPDPDDYWRFTPSGLRIVLERAGLTVQEIGSWGNPEAVRGNLHIWAGMRPWHAMSDRRDTPVVVWAVCQR